MHAVSDQSASPAVAMAPTDIDRKLKQAWGRERTFYHVR